MITAAQFRNASAAAAAAASASRLARCSRPHFIRNTHRRAAIWSLMTSSRSRDPCPLASIPRTCACTSASPSSAPAHEPPPRDLAIFSEEPTAAPTSARR